MFDWVSMWCSEDHFLERFSPTLSGAVLSYPFIGAPEAELRLPGLGCKCLYSLSQEMKIFRTVYLAGFHQGAQDLFCPVGPVPRLPARQTSAGVCRLPREDFVRLFLLLICVEVRSGCILTSLKAEMSVLVGPHPPAPLREK